MGSRMRKNGNGKRNAPGTLRSVRVLLQKGRIFLPLTQRRDPRRPREVASMRRG